MILRRRIAVYGRCLDDQGRVLMVRASARTRVPGTWALPGGGVRHGENPVSALVREVGEETGLRTAVTRPIMAVSTVTPSGPDGSRHTDRIIFEIRLVGRATPVAESDGTSDLADWLSPEQLGQVPVADWTATVLTATGVPGVPGTPVAGPAGPEPVSPGVEAARGPGVRTGQGRARGQRFGAYGLATDAAGRVLLTMIADGYPGAGRWHLPGGGTDFGEQPTDGLLRELVEETGQHGRITRLVAVTHNHNPAAVGPEGYPVDWHVVRVIYRVAVDHPTVAVVTEAAGGSTARAAWWVPEEIDLAMLTASSAKVLRAERMVR